MDFMDLEGWESLRFKSSELMSIHELWAAGEKLLYSNLNIAPHALSNNHKRSGVPGRQTDLGWSIPLTMFVASLLFVSLISLLLMIEGADDIWLFVYIYIYTYRTLQYGHVTYVSICLYDYII